MVQVAPILKDFLHLCECLPLLLLVSQNALKDDRIYPFYYAVIKI